MMATRSPSDQSVPQIPLYPTSTFTVPGVGVGSATSATSILFGPWYTAALTGPVLCDRGHTPKELQTVASAGATRCNPCVGPPPACVLSHMTQTLDPKTVLTPQER